MLQEQQKENRISFGFFLRLFVPFALAFFMSCLLRTINSVLSSTFIEEFSMSAADLGVMTSAYFLSFAIAQVPMGVFLDRYGPSKSLASFLLFGVAGCGVFASAQTVLFLFIGRALVGWGVSGCLMAAYKAFGDWLPKEKLPMFNSMESFVGGVGGMVATTPINAALGFMTWRQVFIVLGVLTFVVAVIVFFAPNKKGDSSETMGKQFKGTLTIASSATFWRLAPVAVLGQATYLALNSLWIGPWFQDVFKADSAEVPNLLFICSVAIAVGYLVNGFIANWVKAKWGVSVFKTTLVAMSIYTALLFAVVIFPQGGKILWPAFVFMGPFSLLTYPIFSEMFDVKLSGRAQTTYNMLVFVMTTVIQSGIGYIIDMFEPVTEGGYNPTGYSVALAIVAASLALSVVWAVFYRRKQDEIHY